MKLRGLICVSALVVFARGICAQGQAPGEVYHSEIAPKPGSTADAVATPIPDAKPRSFFSAHDNRERVIVKKETDKPAQIKKLKFGADQSEDTGKFKGSMLEEEGDLARFKKAVAEHNAAKAGSPAASASPDAEAEKSTPTATPTASPRPSASP